MVALGMRSEGVAPALFVGASPERRIKRARSPAWIIHAPKLETRRQGGLLLRPRAQAGNAAARRPASTSTRPGWKRGGKAACFYVHAPGLETRRQGGLLLRPRARAGSAAARRPAVVALGMRSEGVAPALFVGGSPERRKAGPIASVDHPRAQAGNAAARRPASTSTRPSWKRGGKVACFYVHAHMLVC